MRIILTGAVVFLASAGAAAAQSYPVTIENCGREVVFEQAPQRVTTYDINTFEMLLALGLTDHMVGYTGITGLGTFVPPDLADDLAALPELTPGDPNLEVLLDADVDFHFHGWLANNPETLPESLAAVGINGLEFTEICAARSGEQVDASFEDMFSDLLNLGMIFGVRERAEQLVQDYRGELAAIAERAPENADPVRVFVYDMPGDTAFTCGRYCVLTAMIEAAGGVNIFDDLDASWDSVAWEAMIDRAPEAMIIVDYGDITAEEKIAAILGNSAFAEIPAVQDERFIVLEYGYTIPGPRNISGTALLAEALHP